MKIKVILATITLLCLISLADLIKTTKAVSLPEERSVGGQCSYDEINGLCKVLNLYFNPEKSSGKLVKFKFQPDIDLGSVSLELMKNNDLIDEDQERTLDEIAPASWTKHEKNHLEIGDTIECQLKIESSESCTPIIFSFKDSKKEPSDYANLAFKQTIAEILFLLLPIVIIIIVFIIKYEKFVHKIKKLRKGKNHKR
jgi:hypothetical protein